MYQMENIPYICTCLLYTSNQTRIYTFDKESGGHDLFPVYGEEDKLWLTAASAVYKFDISTDTPTCETVYNTADIKSVCNGPDGILMLKPVSYTHLNVQSGRLCIR